MNYAIDHCDPFDGKKENIWMKAEHLGRYLFAVDYFRARNAEKILDAACAEGFGSAMLAEAGFTVYGTDINRDYLKKAKERCRGTFVACDFERDGLPGAFPAVDGAVCFETIEHLSDGRKLLEGFFRVLGKNGRLLLSFPNAAFEKTDANGINYDPFHKRIYTPKEMADLVGSVGFAVQEIYGQSACNDFYAKEHEAVKSGRLTQKAVDSLFAYDEKSVTDMAKLIGYPDKVRVSDSYSFLWVLQPEK